MQSTTTQVLGPADGERVDLVGLGVRFMIEGGRTDGAFALVEHPLAPRALGAPLHSHRHEDEYSYVLEGHVGIQLGDDVVLAGPGDLVFKPRGQLHTFWNAGDEPARLLEIVSPAGFERYFREAAPLLAGPEPDTAAVEALAPRYGLELDLSSVPALIERHGLRGL